MRAAVGFRAHSGWAAAVVVSGPLSRPTIVEAFRLDLVGAAAVGTVQPYHAVRSLPIAEAERRIGVASERAVGQAREALRALIDRLAAAGASLVAGGLVLAAGRPLPELATILASHPLLHTAEGALFRDALEAALVEHGLPVVGVRERELRADGATLLGVPPEELAGRLRSWGEGVSGPWASDQKQAALVAAIALSSAARRSGADHRP